MERLAAWVLAAFVAILAVFIGLPLMVLAMWWLEEKWRTK